MGSGAGGMADFPEAVHVREQWPVGYPYHGVSRAIGARIEAEGYFAGKLEWRGDNLVEADLVLGSGCYCRLMLRNSTSHV